MALQVWLPLNGTLENKGLSNVTVTNYGAKVDNNGKIGKCYSTNGTYLVANNPITSANTNLTITGWVYLNSGNFAYIYSCRTGLSGIGLFISLETECSIFDDGARWETTYKIPLNTWVHFAFTRNNNGKKLYINGELHSSTTRLGNMNGIHTKMYLGRNFYGDTAGASSNMKMNDFRIYDHCLSAKEVKEISKGLILHYKLDGNDIGILIPRNSSSIPDGVELYDYLLGDGDSYIDSKLPMNRNTTIDYTILMVTNTGLQRMIGHLTTDLHLLTYVGDGTSNIKTYKTLSGSESYIVMIAYNTDKHNYILNEYGTHKIYVDGTYKDTYTLLPSSDTYYGNCYIFWANGASSSSFSKGKCKIYDCKLYDEGVLKRNFLPCTYLGEPGMWDTVENKFYRNQGTGLFTLGNKITLKEYEYLSATKGPYINTGYCHSATTSIDLDAAFNTLYSYNTLLGAATSDNSSDSFCFGTHVKGGLNCDLTRGFCVIPGTAGKLTAGTRFNVKLDVTKAILNGVTYTTGVTTGRACQYAMAIFGRNLSNSYSSEIGDGKVYELKIYDSPGVLVRDFIPVSYNGTPGLWDKVEWKFYANAGTGSFTLGPEKIVLDAPIFYDSSGYCNHGSITGTLTTNNDSPRYTNSIQFGSDKLISTTASGPHILTMSIWAKDAGSTPSDGLMFKDHLGDMALGIQNGILYSGKLGGKGAGNKAISTIGYTANTWHHWVMVNRDNTFYVYMDGQQVLSGTSGLWSAGTVTNALHIGGRSGSSPWPGKLSDFRAYATALSEDDIKELYNTSAFVTDNGVFAEYELYEDNLSDIKKTGLLETADFYENGAESGYSLDTDKTRVASNYIISEEFIEI